MPWLRSRAGARPYSRDRQPPRHSVAEQWHAETDSRHGGLGTLMLHIRIKRNRRVTREPARHLMEVVTPRTNSALISPAEHLCAGLSLHARATGGGPVGLEIVADQERCWFVV